MFIFALKFGSVTEIIPRRLKGNQGEYEVRNQKYEMIFNPTSIKIEVLISDFQL